MPVSSSPPLFKSHASAIRFPRKKGQSGVKSVHRVVGSGKIGHHFSSPLSRESESSISGFSFTPTQFKNELFLPLPPLPPSPLGRRRKERRRKEETSFPREWMGGGGGKVVACYLAD